MSHGRLPIVSGPATSAYVRGMVCARCVLVTRQLAQATGAPVIEVDYGRVEFGRELTKREAAAFAAELEGVGFGLIHEREEVLAEAVELGLASLARRWPAPGRAGLRTELTAELDVPYAWATAAFQRLRGETPAQRYAELLMRRAARLLREGELQAAAIAHALGYAHLSGFSRAFKRHWGASPTQFASA